MNQIDLSGRRAVITGGARGIGYAIAERLIGHGAAVLLWDMDAAALDAAVASLSAKGEAAAMVVDVTREDQVRGAASGAGAVDILVNNAGITGGNAPVWEIDPAQWRQVLEVNLTGPFLCCRALVPGMVARGWGRIVNIASVAGKEGNPNASHYSASKAGVIALTKSLGKELAQKGVLVNAIAPAAAETDIFKQMTAEHIAFMKSKIPMGRFVQVGEIAAMAAWLASPECSFSTGAVFDITGGRSTY